MSGSGEGRGERMALGEVAQLLWRRRRMLVAVAALVLSAVLGVTLASRMKFRARGSLYLGELRGQAGAQLEPLDFMSAGGVDVGTEIEILKSQNLIKRAVLEAGLNVSMVPIGWHAPRYWQWRVAHRDLRLLDLGGDRVVATSTTTNTITSATANSAPVDLGAGAARSFTVRFGRAGAYELWNGAAALGPGNLGTPLQTPTLCLTLRAGPEGPPAAGAVYAVRIEPIDEVVERVAKVMTVAVPKVTGPGEPVRVVTVDYVDASPRAAARFVEALMRAYLDRRQSWKTEEATVAETFVGGQITGIRTALEDAERKLAEYKKGSSVVALGQESKGMIEQLGTYEQQRVAARLQVATFGQIQGLLKEPNAPIEHYLVGETADPILAGLSSNLALAQQELHRVEGRFTPDAPAAQEQRAQVEGQLKMVRDYVYGRFARAQAQLATLNQLIGQFEDRLKTVPRAELDLAQLTRNTEVLNKMYAFLLERQQQAAVTKSSTISQNRILDLPPIPYREDSPVLALRIVAGALLGLLLGMVVVILRWMLAPKLQSEVELMRLVRELETDIPVALPVLARIPLDRAGARRRARQRARISARGFGSSALAPSPAFAEAFRTLRTRLYYDAAAGDDKVVLITSPSVGDGKTLCTLSLAAALSADDKHVLVIEADMHRAWQRARLKQAQRPGLSNVLSQKYHWTEVIRSIPTSRGAFDAITAGTTSADTTNPGELLSSPHFALLLQYARTGYDFVLVDVPSFPLVSDALIVAMHADRIVTVLRPGSTDRNAAQEHLRRLSATKARCGLVVNGVDSGVSEDRRAYAVAYAPSSRHIVVESGRARAVG
jgi:tyrosine-protein kinase Etk/Wzc